MCGLWYALQHLPRWMWLEWLIVLSQPGKSSTWTQTGDATSHCHFARLPCHLGLAGPASRLLWSFDYSSYAGCAETKASGLCYGVGILDGVWAHGRNERQATSDVELKEAVWMTRNAA